MEPSATPSRPPGAQPGPSGRAQRRLRNFLVDGPLQLKLASYLLAVAVLLSASLGWLLWQAYQETSRVIALGDSDPEAGASLGAALAAEDRWRILLVSAALGGVLLCLLAAAVVVSHRIAGPAFALGRTCRAVGMGRLARPGPLRSRDLLVELAGEVAGMVDALRAQEARERAALVEAAAALRDPAAPQALRLAAAEALERQAEEKAGRLA
jgi:hypothetical protein